LRRLDKHIKVFTMGILEALEYKGAFFLFLAGGIFPVLIQYFFWTAVYSNGQMKTIYGYSYTQIITYILLAAIVSKLVSADFIWDAGWEIKNGDINKYLVKPYSYFSYMFFYVLGGKVLQFALIFLLPVGVFSALGQYLSFHLEWNRVLIFLPVIFLALILNMILFMNVAMSAFWLQEPYAAAGLTLLIFNIVSGGIFPLDVFGKQVMNILYYLPFKYTTWFPVNVLTGRITTDEILHGIIFQLIWIVVLYFSFKLVWKNGLKKYTAVGG
jgi:ABC-2 type transport system permease protein